MAHPLEIKVAQVRRRVRRLLVIHGASRALAIVVPAFFVLGGIDYLLRFDDHGVRVIWSLSAAAIAAWPGRDRPADRGAFRGLRRSAFQRDRISRRAIE